MVKMLAAGSYIIIILTFIFQFSEFEAGNKRRANWERSYLQIVDYNCNTIKLTAFCQKKSKRIYPRGVQLQLFEIEMLI